jgi:hypothetical protein
VTDDELVVDGAVHVELDAVGAELDGPPEGGERVVRCVAVRAAVGEDERHDAASYGDARDHGFDAKRVPQGFGGRKKPGQALAKVTKGLIVSPGGWRLDALGGCELVHTPAQPAGER